MNDRQIRRIAQSRRWWYASSRHWGPAHIIMSDGFSLCGHDYDTRQKVQATNLCKLCRKKAIKLFEQKAPA